MTTKEQLESNLNEAGEAVKESQSLYQQSLDTLKRAVETACRGGETLFSAIDAARVLHRQGAFGPPESVRFETVWKDVLARVEVVPELAQRYMSGAKRIREAGGIEALGIRQMTLLFDAEAHTERPTTNRDPENTNWLTHLSRFSEQFVKTLDHRPVSQWSEIERLTFLRKAEPIIKLAKELES